MSELLFPEGGFCFCHEEVQIRYYTPMLILQHRHVSSHPGIFCQDKSSCLLHFSLRIHMQRHISSKTEHLSTSAVSLWLSLYVKEIFGSVSISWRMWSQYTDWIILNSAFAAWDDVNKELQLTGMKSVLDWSKASHVSESEGNHVVPFIIIKKGNSHISMVLNPSHNSLYFCWLLLCAKYGFNSVTF